MTVLAKRLTYNYDSIRQTLTEWCSFLFTQRYVEVVVVVVVVVLVLDQFINSMLTRFVEASLDK